ncbi:MAG: hypothetical protein HC780_24680 [Leptolyngbyaceae cyanobacterium CSU_1_3]|nr:hypothetical protein [Leptolyngbyaceae cyanobacterium CSU_1_3]
MDLGAADPHALKVTTSSQEWCGHTFTQLDRKQDGYLVLMLSYFESEGDQTLTLDVLHRDELWTTIRIDPDTAEEPQGGYNPRSVPPAGYLHFLSGRGSPPPHAALETRTPAPSSTMTGATKVSPLIDRPISIFSTNFTCTMRLRESGGRPR